MFWIRELILTICIWSFASPSLAIDFQCKFAFAYTRLSKGDFNSAHSALLKLQGKLSYDEVLMIDTHIRKAFALSRRLNELDAEHDYYIYRGLDGNIVTVYVKDKPVLEEMVRNLSREIQFIKSKAYLDSALAIRTRGQPKQAIGNVFLEELLSFKEALALPKAVENSLVNTVAGTQALAFRILGNPEIYDSDWVDPELYKSRIINWRTGFRHTSFYDDGKDLYAGSSWREVEIGIQKFSRIKRVQVLVKMAEQYYKQLFAGRPDLYKRFAHTNALIPFVYAVEYEPNETHELSLRKYYLNVLTSYRRMSPRAANAILDDLTSHIKNLDTSTDEKLRNSNIITYIEKAREHSRAQEI